MTVDVDDPQRREAIQGMWTSGSYAEVGDMWAGIGAQLADELAADPGLDGRAVLDAACGTGNTTLALARRGAQVVGVDLTPAMLTIAAERAASEGLDIQWRNGDLLALPADDHTFDAVTSTFGAFTADDPRRCAAELVRVCRSGGTIAVTAWTRRGPFATMRAVVADRVPGLAHDDGPDTAAWAEPDGLDARFDGTGAELVDLQVRIWPLRFTSTADAVAFYSRTSGPALRTRAAVDAHGGDWAALQAAIVSAWQPLTRPADGGIELLAPYAVARLRVV